jgi:hypothetical protein
LAQEGLAALPQTPPLQVLPVYPPLLRDLQQQQGAIFQTVILAVRQVRQQHFLVATHRRPMYRAAVVVAVLAPLGLLGHLLMTAVAIPAKAAPVVLGCFGR